MALTRARQICFIMGPPDVRGLVGAATIMGCLKYGACFSVLDDQDVGILSPSLGSSIKRLTSFDMSLDMQWMALTFRATSFAYTPDVLLADVLAVP